MNKNSRHVAIKQLVTQRVIASQDGLRKALKSSGFPVTQATLSRDMRELRLARVTTPEGPRYVLNPEAEEQRMQPFLGYEIERIEANESLIVVKTLPGRAQGVAEIIDSMHEREILGTLAGDNTIFISPRSSRHIRNVVKILRAMTQEKKQNA